MTEDQARNRYFAMVFAQMIAVAGAVFGRPMAGMTCTSTASRCARRAVLR